MLIAALCATCTAITLTERPKAQAQRTNKLLTLRGGGGLTLPKLAIGANIATWGFYGVNLWVQPNFILQQIMMVRPHPRRPGLQRNSPTNTASAAGRRQPPCLSFSQTMQSRSTSARSTSRRRRGWRLRSPSRRAPSPTCCAYYGCTVQLLCRCLPV